MQLRITVWPGMGHPLTRLVLLPCLFALAAPPAFGVAQPGSEIGVAGTPYHDPGELLYTRGYIAFTRGEYEKAAALLEQVLKLDPDHARATRLLGLCRLHLNEFAAAAELFASPAAQSDQTYRTAFNLGLAHLYRGDHTQALAAFEQALETAPYYALIRYYVGYIYFHRGDFTRAAESFARVLELDPTLEATARYYLAESQYRLGDLAGAEAEFARLLASPASDPHSLVTAARQRHRELARRDGGFHASATFGEQYTSEVVLFPDNPTPEEISRSGDLRSVVALQVRATSTDRQGTRAGVELSANLTSQTERSDFNVHSYALSLLAGYRDPAAAIPLDLELAYNYTVSLVANHPDTFGHLDLFSIGHTVTARARLQESEAMATELRYRFALRSFGGGLRNGRRHGIETRQYLTLAADRVVLALGASLTTNQAVNDLYSFLRPAGLLDLHLALPWEIAAELRCDVAYEVHGAGSADTGPDRTDTTLAAEAALRRKITDLWHLSLRYGYRLRDSNYRLPDSDKEAFDHSGSLVSLSATASW